MLEFQAEHSALGASGASRWLACPGSFTLNQIHPTVDKGSEYAALGTAAHELAALCIDQDIDAWEHVGVEFSGFDVTDNSKAIDPDAVQIYINYCRDLISRSAMYYTELPIGKTFKPDPLFFGTADFVAIELAEDNMSVERLTVADLKFGEGLVVSPINNAQLLYYAHGVMNELTVRRYRPDTIVDLVIVQPRGQSETKVKTWSTNAGVVNDWARDILLPGMSNAREKPDMFVAGEHCRWCNAKIYCPVLKQEFANMAEQVAPTETLSDADLDSTFDKIAIVKTYVAAVEAEAHARLLSGATLQTAKLVPKRSVRMWVDGVQEKLEAKLGNEAFTRSLKSPAQVEKIGKDFKLFVAEHAFMPEAMGYNVVPVADPTPGANVSADLTREFAHMMKD